MNALKIRPSAQVKNVLTQTEVTVARKNVRVMVLHVMNMVFVKV
jgi:hypothetical protein